MDYFFNYSFLIFYGENMERIAITKSPAVILMSLSMSMGVININKVQELKNGLWNPEPITRVACLTPKISLSWLLCMYEIPEV